MKTIFTILCVCTFYAVQAQTGKVGIGTTSPKAQLHTTGSVRFDSLKGTGNRLVYVDSSGMLYTTYPQYINTTPYDIPDGNCQGVTSIITVIDQPVAIPSGNIRVRINITHPYDGDLFIYLVSPGGQVLNLAAQNGGNGDNFTNTIFWDSATLSLSQFPSAPPFTGTYKPTGSLASNICSATVGTISTFGALGGGTIVPNGNWSLMVIDRLPAYVGKLNNWSITFNNTNPTISEDPFSSNYVLKSTASGSIINSSIYDNGDVGIGTTSPVATLDVVSANNLTDNIFNVRSNNLEQGVGINYNTISAIGTNPNVDFTVASKGGSSKVLINPVAGNVGIGDPAPNVKLSVNGEIKATGNITSNGNIGIGTLVPVAKLDVVSFDNVGNIITARSNNLEQGVGINYNTISAIGTNSNVDFTVASKGGSSKVLINPVAGNVGIGTASPAQKLDVAGNVNATGFTTPQTGSANMVAAAYGNVSGNATNTFNTSSGNCTLAHTIGFGQYTITFTGSNLANAALGNLPVTVCLFGATLGFITWSSSANGALNVYTFNSSGIPTDRGFGFAVYKP